MGEMVIIDNYLLVKMPEEIDHHCCEELGKRADRFLMQKEVSNVVFDFEDTKFMDSSGIGVLIGRYKKISKLGGKVYVIHTCSRIKRILTMSGMQKIVEILD